MFDLDFRAWSLWVWWLYAFAAYCLVGFTVSWFRFHTLAAAAEEGMPSQVERFNRAIRGFPNRLFAKMMGLSPIEPHEPSEDVSA